MKTIVLTRGDEGVSAQTDISVPIIKQYAKKIGADFQMLDQDLSGIPQLANNLGKYHYRLFTTPSFLDYGYERFIHIDADCIIHPECPDLFDIVDEDKIGTVFEDVGSRRADRRNRLEAISDAWGGHRVSGSYINTGVFVWSACHMDIMRCHDIVSSTAPKEDILQSNYRRDLIYWVKDGYDDVAIRWMIEQKGYDMHPLPRVFNLMSMWTESWCGLTLDDAKIIHFAGAGHTSIAKNRVKQMQIVRDAWYG